VTYSLDGKQLIILRYMILKKFGLRGNLIVIRSSPKHVHAASQSPKWCTTLLFATSCRHLSGHTFTSLPSQYGRTAHVEHHNARALVLFPQHAERPSLSSSERRAVGTMTFPPDRFSFATHSDSDVL